MKSKARECLRGGIERKLTESGEAGSGRLIPDLLSDRIPDLSSDLISDLMHFFGLAADFIYTNFSHGRDLDCIFTHFRGPTIEKLYEMINKKGVVH